MFQPSADLAVLQRRAQLLRQLRAFFYDREVMEVDVPVLGDATVTDVYIEPLQVAGEHRWFLQTSPEYYMKRLLAAGSGSIFYLGKAFRSDERGRRHRAEFTMLEWYRQGFSDVQLMEDIAALFSRIAPAEPVHRITYGRLFESKLGLCPYRANVEQLRRVASERVDFSGTLDTKSAWLDLLFSHCIEPELKSIFLVHDYPREQCALARLGANEDGVVVAKRFEVFWQGVELANGYWELSAAAEQRQRFLADQQQRQHLGFAVPAMDERFMAALDHGLPDCSGVALGVDRLLMCLLGADDIAQVMPFADH